MNSKILIKESFIGLLLGLFIFISYINHTISLSYIIMGLLILYILYSLIKNKSHIRFQYLFSLKSILFSLALLTLWILFQPFILHFAFPTEIKGQFIVPLSFFFIGILLPLLQHKYLTPKIMLNIVFFSGFLHLLIVVFSALYIFFTTGELPIRKVYIVPFDEINYLSGIMYAMFLAEIYNRIINQKSFLYLKGYLLPFIFLIFVFSIYIQGVRWGVVTFTGTTIFFIIILMFKAKISNLKKLVIFSISIILLSGLIYKNIQYDKRWKSIIETVNIVLHDKSLYWVNRHKYPCPKLSNGKCVDLSNYLRPSQQIHGYKLLLDYPNGTGYSRYSYKNAIQHKYDAGENSFNFPHSSILNLAIGIGFVGIFLYFLFLFFTTKKLLGQQESYYKFFTLFFLVTFHARAMVDSILMNHNLKIFFLLLGIGLISSIIKSEEKVA